MTSPINGAHIRVARPTNNIPALKHFYHDGLGLDVLFEFRDKAGEHAGFDGIMLGHQSHGYHLEFTQKRGHDAGRAPTEENLLVFYLPEQGEWNRAVQRMISAGYQPVQPFNIYWDPKGKTFEDPDGYRIVLQNASWSN